MQSEREIRSLRRESSDFVALLHQLGDDFPAIALRLQGDVYPGGGAGGGVLPDELVERHVPAEPLKPLPTCAERGEADVGGTAGEVVAAGAAAHGPVERGAAVATADADGLTGEAPQRLQNLRTQVLQVPDVLLARGVADAAEPGGVRAGELGEGKVLSELHRQMLFLFDDFQRDGLPSGDALADAVAEGPKGLLGVDEESRAGPGAHQDAAVLAAVDAVAALDHGAAQGQAGMGGDVLTLGAACTAWSPGAYPDNVVFVILAPVQRDGVAACGQAGLGVL